MARPRALPIALALVLCANILPGRATSQIPAPQAPPSFRELSGFEQTQGWLRLARKHTFGDLDEVARDVASYSPVTTARLLDDIQLIRLLVAVAGRQPTAIPYADHTGRRLRFDQLALLLGIDPSTLSGPFTPAELGAPDSPMRRAIAQLMTQVAMLHTDIAMATNDLAPRAGARGVGTAIQLRDGRELVVSNMSVHWSIAREAMAMVLPATIGTAAARQWYHATIAFMQADRNYAGLLPHLETARTLMPADAWIWQQSGVAYENLAAPAVQVAVTDAGSSAKVEEPMILLGRAEIMLKRALTLDAANDITRVRLGHVLDLTGRHQEAAAMLTVAEKQLTDPVLKYYAALFAGRAWEADSQIDNARLAFERAMALFPRAQSPRLALAEIAWRTGAQQLAQSGLRALFVTGGADRSTDPWWIYDTSLVTNWQDQILEMRRSAAEVAGR